MIENAARPAGNVQVVAAVLRRAGELLLVEEKGPGDAKPIWALPGGVVERGELLFHALRRELREETGLEVQFPVRPLYVVQHEALNASMAASASRLSTIYVFEAAAWTGGEPAAADPDGLVLRARFMPIAEALEALATVPYRIMREPLLALLKGETEPGVTWFYEQEGDEEPRLLGTIG